MLDGQFFSCSFGRGKRFLIVVCGPYETWMLCSLNMRPIRSEIPLLTKPFVVGLVVTVFTGLTILRGFAWADKRRDLYPRGLITGIKKPF